MSTLGAFLTVARGQSFHKHVQQAEGGQAHGKPHQAQDHQESPSIRRMLRNIEEQDSLIIGHGEVESEISAR